MSGFGVGAETTTVAAAAAAFVQERADMREGRREGRREGGREGRRESERKQRSMLFAIDGRREQYRYG